MNVVCNKDAWQSELRDGVICKSAFSSLAESKNDCKQAVKEEKIKTA